MSLSAVIALGHIAYWHVFFTSWSTLIFLAAIVGFAFIGRWLFRINWDGWSLLAWTLSIMSTFVMFVYISTEQDVVISNWRTAYAYPYIASLPVHRHDIVYIKVQDTSQVDGGGGLFTFYVSSWDLTHVLVLYKVGDSVNKADLTAKLSMRLSPTAQPYITYQRLPHSLGDGVHAGLYNVTIHLPRDYKFQTIQ